VTDLANIWVRTTRLELIRADQIVSLSIGDPSGDGPAPAMIFADMKSGPPADHMLRLMASVAGSAAPREIHLRSYEFGDAVPALTGLADALAAAVGRSEPMLFVYPHLGAGARWEVTTALPREWIAGPPTGHL
jgi:hypothetical protein